MDILKTLGLGVYYRVRRISKAVKNWKKFGVIVFGSMFLASSVLPGLAQPVSATALAIGISSTTNNIELGGSVTFAARAFYGLNNDVTNDPGLTLTWTADFNGSTVASGSGITWNFRPAAAGIYTVDVRGMYDGVTAFAQVPATVTVHGADNTQYLVSFTPAGTQTIPFGQSITYTAEADLGTQDVSTQSGYGWIISRTTNETVASGSSRVFTYTPSAPGTYNVKVRGVHDASNHSAWSEEARLIVTDDIPQTDVCTAISIRDGAGTVITNNSLTLTLNNGTASANLRAFGQKANGDSIQLNNVVWSKGGVGSLNPTTGINTTFTTNTQGTATINVTSANCPGAGTLNVTVNQAPVNQAKLMTKVVISPNPGQGLVGQTIPFSAQAYYANPQGGADLPFQVSDNVTYNWTLVNQTLGGLNGNVNAKTATGQNINFISFQNTPAGQYGIPTLMVQAVYNGNQFAYDYAGINLQSVVVNQTITHVLVTVDRTPIYTHENTMVRAQAYSGNTPLTSGVTYFWEQLSGPGSLASNRNTQDILFSAQGITGFANLKVTATNGSSSASGQATVQIITQTCNPVYGINITPDPAYVPAGERVTLTATATDGCNNINNVSNFNWTSLNSAAGYIESQSGNTAVWRAGQNTGDFDNAVQVSNGFASDRGDIVVTGGACNVNCGDRHFLDYTLHGVVEDGGQAAEGKVIRYTLTLTNNRNNTVHNVHTTVDVPTYTTFLSATSGHNSPSISGRTISWNPGNFTHGQSKTMTFRVTINYGLGAGQKAITAYGRAWANEISGFNMVSNTIYVQGVTSQNPQVPQPPVCTPYNCKGLPNTGSDAWIYLAIAGVSLGLAFFVYRAVNNRKEEVYFA